MTIREALQAGRARKLSSIAVGLAFLYLIEASWGWFRATQLNPLDMLQKVAFVAAAFSVTAYNLRTRVIDLTLKIEGSPGTLSHITRVARGCGKRLTNLVVLFTVTAVLMGAAGFFPVTLGMSRWYGSAIAGLFGAAVVNFVYVLFAFERLERYMLDDAEERARKREAKRLLGQNI